MSEKVRLYLVRHGRTSRGWDEELDPGLNESGRKQAERMAQRLAGLGPLPIMVSPMRRARETAAALETVWSNQAEILSAVSEIPSPTGDLKERTAWLLKAMAGTWSELEPTFISWRDEVLRALASIRQETVIISHFIAINAAVGAAAGDDRLVCFRPDYCSVTTLEVGDGRIELVELGREAETTVG